MTGMNEMPTARIVLPARQTPVYRSVDVLVCGGGLAGTAAAVAAARAGADTLLVERNVVLGGNGPLAFLVGLPSGSGAISAGIAERLLRAGEAGPDQLAPDKHLVYDPEALKYALLDLVREAGAGLLLSTWVSDPILKDGAVHGAMVENKSGRFAVAARVVIDATGDGDLALRAGATLQAPADAPSLSMNCRVGGIDFERAFSGRADWPRLIGAAKADGRLDAAQPDDISLYGVTDATRGRGIAFLRGARLAGGSACDAVHLTGAESVARVLMRQFLGFLRTVPGFEASFLVDVAGTLGITRSRHVVGDHVLGLTEALEGRRHADDILDTSAGFGIPYRCLLPAGVDNLLVAGGAVSVAPDVYRDFADAIDPASLGEIAGVAAAGAARAGLPPRALDAGALRRDELASGARHSGTASSPLLRTASPL
jgi:hypothetical protein